VYTQGETSFAERWYAGGNPPRCVTSGHGLNGFGAREEPYTVYEDQARAIRKDRCEIGVLGGGSM
jgi:hypothetical protein